MRIRGDDYAAPQARLGCRTGGMRVCVRVCECVDMSAKGNVSIEEDAVAQQQEVLPTNRSA